MEKSERSPGKRKKSSHKSKKTKKRKHSSDEYRIQKMTKKLHTYLSDRRLDKVKKLMLEFNEMDCYDIFTNQLNKVYGKQEWTYLHDFSSKGEVILIDFILNKGAKTNILDKQANNFLHFAFNYVIDSFDRNFLYYMVSILPDLPEEMLAQRNDYGETAVDLLEEITDLLQNRHKQFLEPDSESESELIDEASWNERLFMEMAEDEGSCYGSEKFIQEEFEDTFRKRKCENFQEWGDRMWKEYHLKHSKEKTQPRQNKKTEKERDKVKIGPKNNVKELRANLEIIQCREKYEEACFNLFRKNEDLKIELTVDDIPWTYFPGYTKDNFHTGKVLDGMIKMFSHGFTDEDKIKYFKVQRIRWHPDKFRQKCGHRLSEKDKNKILDLVKAVSQRVNSELDSLLANAVTSSSKT